MMKTIEYLILDYKRKTEAAQLLKSIRAFSHFPHSVTFLDNGSDEDYPQTLQKEGLIDNLIINKTNVGCGAGTIQLFAQSFADYVFYVQVDHELIHVINEDMINYFIDLIENKNFCYVDVAGNQGHGNYSERAQFISPKFYNSIPKSIGGPGPWCQVKWTEECIQNYIKENNLRFCSISSILFADKGKYSVRSNPDGSKWIHRTDNKQVSLIEGKVKEKYNYPPFSNEQWAQIIETQKCENVVPKEWENCVFEYWT